MSQQTQELDEKDLQGFSEDIQQAYRELMEERANRAALDASESDKADGESSQAQGGVVDSALKPSTAATNPKIEEVGDEEDEDEAEENENQVVGTDDNDDDEDDDDDEEDEDDDDDDDDEEEEGETVLETAVAAAKATAHMAMRVITPTKRLVANTLYYVTSTVSIFLVPALLLSAISVKQPRRLVTTSEPQSVFEAE